MKAGSDVLRAIKAGDIVEILFGLVNLAYIAVEAIAAKNGEISDLPVTWRHDGSVISLMRILSDKISQCSSGRAEDYSAVYCLCVHLTRSFINADFDKAFQIIHQSCVSTSTKSSRHGVADEVGILSYKAAPDLSDCLYE